VVAPEVGGELVPSDSVRGGVSSGIHIPPSRCGPLKSSCSIQDLLSVIALTGSVHLQHCLQPILSFKRISSMSEHGGWWLMNSWCLLRGAGCCTGGLLGWACMFATVLVRFWRS
jgi:hypothetical protein